MLGVTFGSKHSYNDWGIWLEDTHINPPLPKRYIVDVPARNGLLDLTPELTPTIRFENRTLTFTFRVKAGDWSTLLSQIYGQIHGRTLNVISDLDPQWHWHGCVTVDDFSSDERTGKLVITVDADPFKLSNTENSYTVNGNGTITCVVDRMEISPAFELTAPTTVIYGDSSYAIESTATTEKTLSGDIVSFVDGTANPAVDLTADIEAVQDLHGYDHPWVGGAGKNIANFVGNIYSTGSGLTITSNSNGSISFSGTATQSYAYLTSAITCNIASGTTITLSRVTARPYRVYIHVTYSDSTSGDIIIEDNTTSITTTLAKNVTTIQLICSHLSTSTAYNETIFPMLEIGSAQTSFEPYSNICPISGWDEVNVYRIGKNWCNKDGDLVLGFWITSGGVPSITANTSNIAFNYKIPIPKGEALTLSANTSINNFGYCIFQADGTYINRINNNNTSSVTIASTTFDRYVLLWVNRNNVAFSSLNSAREWLLSAEIQFEYSTQRTEFVSDGQTYTIDLDGTRYGGSLDVTTGVLTVTWKYITLDGVTSHRKADSIASSQGLYYSICNISDDVGINTISGKTALISDQFIEHAQVQIGNCYITYNGTYLVFVLADQTLSTLADINNWLAQNTPSMCYELATPQVVQLTPTQVTTLLGQNNIWADSGEVEVTYLAQDFAGKTFYIPDLELAEGSHELTIQGTGTTTVTYTNGRL